VNTVDAALARLTGARTTSEIDRLAFGGVLRAAATTDKVAAPYATDANGALQGSMRVHKLGRTTGYTEGIVTGLGGVATIPYGAQTAHFANQIVVSPTTDNGGPFSKRGDSGSGVLNDRHELVGLLFAGAALQTLVNPIADVFLQLRAAAAAVGVRGLELVCV
jgi:hypothetical protein